MYLGRERDRARLTEVNASVGISLIYCILVFTLDGGRDGDRAKEVNGRAGIVSVQHSSADINCGRDGTKKGDGRAGT